MTLRLTASERARLGLIDAEPGEPEVLEIAVAPVHQGRGATPGIVASGLVAGNVSSLSGLVASLFAGEEPTTWFIPLASRTLRDANLSASIHQQNHGLVLVESPATRLHGRHAVTSDALVHPDNDPGAIVADLNAGPAAIELSDGSRILLEFRKGSIMLHWVAPPSEVPLPETIFPPLHRLQQDSRDPWARGLVKPALAALDPWSRLVAIGTFCRLWEPARANAVKAAVARAIAGRPEPHEEALNEWAGNLTDAETGAIRRNCLGRINALHRLLDDLDLAMNPDDPDWLARFRWLCRERDDLESARAVLLAADAVDDVDAALEGLDEAGRSFMATLPVVIAIDDERLQRAARTDPDAWWAEPALA